MRAGTGRLPGGGRVPRGVPGHRLCGAGVAPRLDLAQRRQHRGDEHCEGLRELHHDHLSMIGRCSREAQPSWRAVDAAKVAVRAALCYWRAALAATESVTHALLRFCKRRRLDPPCTDAPFGRAAVAEADCPITNAFAGAKRLSRATESGRVLVVRRGSPRRHHKALVFGGKREQKCPSERHVEVWCAAVGFRSRSGDRYGPFAKLIAIWERRLAVAPAWRLGVAPLRVGWCVWLIFSDWWVRWRLVERSP